MENRKFRLFRGDREVRLEALEEDRWRILAASRETGFLVGDEVCPRRRLTWQEARRRVNSVRSALGPGSLVLLRGRGHESSESEVRDLLRNRPWDPERPPAA